MSLPVKPRPSIFKSPVLPLTGLAWLGLVYTWLRGHVSCHQIGERLPLFSIPTGLFNPFSEVSICLFKQITHLPCVFCGMTRSFILIAQGRPLESIAYHWLGVPVYLLTCLLAIGGLCYPEQTHQALRRATQKRPVAVVFGLLVLGWLWKLGHAPRFW
ncbi:DUF2752 domain-containing protein [Vampirovibrio sp.]|uniref:DUF2752 domain-containing protein n=1 Tax=Vampirovibrio sp. TaxID=2717857 RepID=UPI00359412E6